MTLIEALNNLPKEIHPVDYELYKKNYIEILKIEASGFNRHMLECLKNSNFWIIRNYIENNKK